MRTLLLAVSLSGAQIVIAQEPLHDKMFFANSRMPNYYFFSEATYTGPSWIKNSHHKLPVSETVFFTPGNALELHYISAKNGNWQAKVIYRPQRGIDFFKPATHLTFRMYIQSGTAPAGLPAIAVGATDKKLSPVLPIQDYIGTYRTKEWIIVSIPLEKFGAEISLAIKDINVVAFQQQAATDKENHLFIDQLELSENKATAVKTIPQSPTAIGYEKHVDLSWDKITDTAVKYIKIYRSADNKQYYPVAIESPVFQRYADFVDTTGSTYHYKISLVDYQYKESPLSNPVKAATRPMSDQQLLDMVQEASFRYYWEGAEANSGLSPECIPGRTNMIAAGASGFGIMALIVGAEKKFITRQQAIDRFDKITRFLTKAEKFHGAFPHFIDGPTGKVEPFFGQNDNGADLVETSFLLQGLLTAREYFNADNAREKNIRDRITKIWQEVEWNWFRKEQNSKYLYWHWSPDKAWVINHKLIGWNETLITYFLAIAAPNHPVPASFYYSGWASQEEEAQQYRKAWGKTAEGALYANGNTYYGIPLKIGVSNGGPLFFVHYSFLGLDPRQLKDAYTDYFSNNRNIARINQRYCIENPGNHKGYAADCWGITASDGPWDYSANEPVKSADEGKMTPTGALASFPYLPEAAMNALKKYYRHYGKFLWGAYGFRDAFNLDENWSSELYMGLNQAPIIVMIENHRTGLLWKLFMNCPEIKAGLKKLAAEKP